MTATEPGELGDGPSSHETAGQFPADEVAGPEDRRAENVDIPSSHETSGQFPADDVAGDTPPAQTETEPGTPAPPADETPPPAAS